MFCVLGLFLQVFEWCVCVCVFCKNNNGNTRRFHLFFDVLLNFVGVIGEHAVSNQVIHLGHHNVLQVLKSRNLDLSHQHGSVVDANAYDGTRPGPESSTWDIITRLVCQNFA